MCLGRSLNNTTLNGMQRFFHGLAFAGLIHPAFVCTSVAWETSLRGQARDLKPGLTSGLLTHLGPVISLEISSQHQQQAEASRT